MNEAVWTLIGLLAAATFGNWYWVSSKMDALATRVEARIDRLDGRIEGLDARLTGRLDALTARMDTHLETHHG